MSKKTTVPGRAAFIFKVCNREGIRIAECIDSIDAASIVQNYTDGYIEVFGLAMWREGPDGNASESFDTVSNVIWQRMNGRRQTEPAIYAKVLASIHAMAKVNIQSAD